MPRLRLLALAPAVVFVVLLPFAGASGGRAQDAATPAASPASGATASGWTNWKGDAGRTGVADAGPTGQPVQLWRVQAGGPCNHPPAIVAEVVYAPCDDGVLYALDAATGTERWRFIGTALGEVTAVGDLVYVNDADVLRALDAATGQERWQVAVVGGTSAVVDDGLLVIGTGDGYLLGLDAATATERWRYQLSTTGAAHNPVLGDGIAYAGGDDPGFFAVDAASGQLLWKGDTGNDRTATAVVAEGIAYIGGSPDSGVGHLYAFDATTGVLRWTRDEPLFTPTVLDGVGYAGGTSGIVNAFDTADGAELWQAQLGGVVPNMAIADGVLYALSDGNNAVYALDAATGAQLWDFPLDGGIDGGVAVGGGVAYVGTVFGGIYAIGGTDQGTVPVATPAPATPAPSSSPAPPTASPVAGGGAEFLWQTTGGTQPFGLETFVTIAPDGRIWVADGKRSLFQIFDPDGTFVEEWGTPGSGDGELNLVADNGDGSGDIAFAPDGSFYVSDTGNRRVQHFDRERRFVAAWGEFGSGDGQFVYPSGIAVDAAGNVFVSDFLRDDVQKFDADGRFLLKFGGAGSGPGQLDGPWGLDIDPNGNVWVADPAHHRVQGWDNEGQFLTNWGEDGSLGGPTAVAFDAAGRMFVVDIEGHRVLVLTPDGQVLATWGDEGNEEGQFREVVGSIAVDGQGDVYVTSFGPTISGAPGVVQKFRLLPPLASADGTPPA